MNAQQHYVDRCRALAEHTGKLLRDFMDEKTRVFLKRSKVIIGKYVRESERYSKVPSPLPPRRLAR